MGPIPTSRNDFGMGYSSFRVLGIAMVVDQRGNGARTVMRYPTTQNNTSDDQDLFYTLTGRQMSKLFRPKPALCGQPMTLSVGGTVFCCCAVLMDEHQQTDMNDPQSGGDYQSDDDNKDSLVLFSVIVALAPQVRSSPLPLSGRTENIPVKSRATDQNAAASQEECALESFRCIRRVHVSLGRLCRVLEREERRCRYVSLQANLFDQIRHDLTSSNGINNKSCYTFLQNNQDHSDENHPLKRDEPVQDSNLNIDMSSSHLKSISNAASQQQQSQPPPIPQSPPPTTTSNTAGASPVSLVSSKAATTVGTLSAPPSARPQHRKMASKVSVSFDREITIPTANKTAVNKSSEKEMRQQERQFEQVILETMMSAPPTSIHNTSKSVVIEHQGNLARELVQVYHALGRKDSDFPPTPSILLSGREGVVYVNRHIAIAVESVSSQSLLTNLPSTVLVRPYHTLLFPSASPGELLDSMTSATTSSSRSSAAPRRLQQLLRMVHPLKSLKEIAIDTNLPLPTALELATYLVGQGACRAAPVLSRQIRLAASCTMRIQDSALAFSQEFGATLNLFVLVGFLTEASRTLGEAMVLLSTSDDATVVWLRECFLSSCLSVTRKIGSNSEPSMGVAVTMKSGRFDSFPESPNSDHDRVPNADDMEELMYQMVVWLCSHEVLVHIQDYLMVKFPLETGSSHQSNDFSRGTEDGASTSEDKLSLHQQLNGNNINRFHPQKQNHSGSEYKNDSSLRLDLLSDEQLFKELLNSDCLTGTVTVTACCWKCGLDSMKLYQFVARNPNRIRIIQRIRTAGDDWEGN